MIENPITGLQSLLKDLDHQISGLEVKKQAIANCIKVFAESPLALKISSDKVTIPKKKKILQPGILKLSQGILRVFESTPDRMFYNSDIVAIMNKSTAAGEVKKPNKDMPSAVASYLWNFEKRGIIKRIRVEGNATKWEYAGKRFKDKRKSRKSLESPDIALNLDANLDAVILNHIARYKKITLPDLVNRIKMSEHYANIAKELSGTLAASVEDRLRNMVAEDTIIWNTDNQYCLK